MKSALSALAISIVFALPEVSSAPFGSVPLEEPTTEISTPGSAASTTPPPIQVDPAPVPGDSGASPSVWDTPPPNPSPAVTQPAPNTAGHKWVQDSRGARYQVSANAALPPGWVEIPAPAMSPQPQVQVQTLPAPVPNPNLQQPQTYSGGQPQVNLPREQVQPQSNLFHAPNPNMTPYQMSAGAPGSGLPPGKKRLRHVSGYTVIVSESTTPGPEFTEIESSSAPAAPQAPQNPVAGGYPVPPQAPPQQPPQTYNMTQSYAPQQQPQYYQQPQTYNSTPQLPHVPPTWQQQLPYQPPQPQYQPPAPGQMPYPQQMQQQAPLPVVRKTPTGKKWVADQSGLRYLVDESTVVMPPMREVTEEELNQPMYIGPQPGQQQQQPQGSAIGRFFQGLTNR